MDFVKACTIGKEDDHKKSYLWKKKTRCSDNNLAGKRAGEDDNKFCFMLKK